MLNNPMMRYGCETYWTLFLQMKIIQSDEDEDLVEEDKLGPGDFIPPVTLMTINRRCLGNQLFGPPGGIITVARLPTMQQP